MELINHSDLLFINKLSSIKYKNHSLSSKINENDKARFDGIKKKLKSLATHFSNYYTSTYGPFKTTVSPYSNPITRGNTLNYVWSTFYKGGENKQYSAQISFVIDKEDTILSLGFFFGSASSHDNDDKKKNQALLNLRKLGPQLISYLANDNLAREKFDSLFDLGFISYSNDQRVLPNEWLHIIETNPENSNISIKVKLLESGQLDFSLIDFYVFQLVYLMSAFGSTNSINKKQIKPFTSEQFIKKAVRLAEIGLKGENFIFEKEKSKLLTRGRANSNYPVHVSLISPSYGYDILSLDEKGNEIYIEVKTTTRPREDPSAKTFFISNHEYHHFEINKNKYKVLRVYSIEDNPSYEEINMNTIQMKSDGYIITY